MPLFGRMPSGRLRRHSSSLHGRQTEKIGKSMGFGYLQGEEERLSNPRLQRI